MDETGEPAFRVCVLLTVARIIDHDEGVFFCGFPEKQFRNGCASFRKALRAMNRYRVTMTTT